MKKIPINQPLVPDIFEYNKYLVDIFHSKKLTNDGPLLQELESELKDIMEVQNNSIFCNGTTALMIALKSLDLKGSVITTPFTFPATANAIKFAGATPIFCDIDYETMNITPEKAFNHINNFTSAILPVHVFGTPCDVEGFDDLARVYGVKIIYDAAHAFNTKINDTHIGRFGNITMFSFHATKLFHTIEGGMLTYNNPELDITIKQLRNFGIRDGNTGSIVAGINGKLNELQAAMGLCILEKINDEIKKRKKVFELYKSFLSEISWIKFLKTEKNVQNSYQYFPIRIKKFRNKIYEHLKNNDIESRKYFYPLCSDFEHFKHIRSYVPNAVAVSEEILCLPFYGDLESNDIERICEEIKIGAEL